MKPNEQISNPENPERPLSERLLDAYVPDSGSFAAYRKEVQAMLEDQEKALRREKRFTTVMWIYIVSLTTVLLTGSGLLMVHKIEGTFMAVTAVFWYLFGAVFLLSHLINKSRFEVIKEIKGVELRVAAMEERLARADRD